jgi:hypothetical protein
MTIINSILTNKDLETAMINAVTDVISSDKVKQQVSTLILELLHNDEIQKSAYQYLKDLVKDFVKDEPTKQLLVTYLSGLLLESLSAPVNEQTVKDKVVELIDSPEVKSSLTTQLVAIADSDTVKTEIGLSAVEAVVAALKAKYPHTYGLIV